MRVDTFRLKVLKPLLPCSAAFAQRMLMYENESAEKEKDHVVDFCKWNSNQQKFPGQHVQNDKRFIIKHLIIRHKSREKRRGCDQ